MNDYHYRYIVEENKRFQDFANQEAWKYEVLYKYHVSFFIPFLMKPIIKTLSNKIRYRTQKCIACCEC